MEGVPHEVEQLLSRPPACINEAGTWCQQVWRITGNEWLAGSAEWLVARPLKILLILLVAVVIRMLLRRFIDRLTKVPNGNGKAGRVPTLLRPLREKASDIMGPTVIERRRQRAQTIGSVLKSVTTFLVFGIALMVVLGELGINLGPIIASAGIVGVALGFGAQNLVRDFLSGIFMMVEDQYGVGDIVDLGEASGTVEAVGLRITTLRDIWGTVWYVRNGEVLRVGNKSQGHAVALVDIPISYNADVAMAHTLVEQIATETVESEAIGRDVLAAPEVLGVENVTPESITMRVTVKVRGGRQWAVQRALRAEIVTGLERAGFEPPLLRLFGGQQSEAQQPAGKPPANA